VNVKLIGEDHSALFVLMDLTFLLIALNVYPVTMAAIVLSVLTVLMVFAKTV